MFTSSDMFHEGSACCISTIYGGYYTELVSPHGSQSFQGCGVRSEGLLAKLVIHTTDDVRQLGPCYRFRAQPVLLAKFTQAS